MLVREVGLCRCAMRTSCGLRERTLVLTCGRSWLFCRWRSSPAAATPGWGRPQPGESSCSTADPQETESVALKEEKEQLPVKKNRFTTILCGLGKLYGFIKSKGLDEMGILVCREAVPVEGEVGDLGHWPPERTLNQTMAAAKRSATVASIFHCCANSPRMHRK